jgi:hypothetical protein
MVLFRAVLWIVSQLTHRNFVGQLIHLSYSCRTCSYKPRSNCKRMRLRTLCPHLSLLRAGLLFGVHSLQRRMYWMLPLQQQTPCTHLSLLRAGLLFGVHSSKRRLYRLLPLWHHTT